MSFPAEEMKRREFHTIEPPLGVDGRFFDERNQAEEKGETDVLEQLHPDGPYSL